MLGDDLALGVEEFEDDVGDAGSIRHRLVEDAVGDCIDRIGVVRRRRDDTGKRGAFIR